jgi:hypothetical protein
MVFGSVVWIENQYARDRAASAISQTKESDQRDELNQ